MALLKILDRTSEVLKTPTKNLTKEEVTSEEISRLLSDMVDTCLATGAVGLAANQVGVPKSLFVFNEPGTDYFQAVFNPKIISKKELAVSKAEGCMSIPGERFNVKRYKKIVIEGLDKSGNVIIFKTKSRRVANIFQHEIDHLLGITIADKGKRI